MFYRAIAAAGGISKDWAQRTMASDVNEGEGLYENNVGLGRTRTRKKVSAMFLNISHLSGMHSWS